MKKQTILSAFTFLTIAIGLAQPAAAASVAFHTTQVDGINIFYRESGPKDAPTVLLLHGFPSSSHMFRNLMPQLAEHYHVVAPDYPGFGYSAQPSLKQFSYTFTALADLIDDFAQTIGVQNYVLYMQDYGGPVGFRLAVKHPERVRALIVQNATIAAEGWNADVTKPFGPYWKHHTAKTEAPMRGFLKAETTKWQYTQGEPDVAALNPDAWTHDQVALDRKGNDAVQLRYLWNYQDNLAQYPVWQDYLKNNQPPLLIVWGKNDPFFTLAGVKKLEALAPKAETHLYDAGHFALESHGDEIAATIQTFLAANIK